MRVKGTSAETLLLLGTLAWHFCGVATAVPARPVHGLLGRPGLLPATLPRGKKAGRVEWIFQTEGVRIATFEGGTLRRPQQGDRFGQRLQMAGEATLRIRDLQPGDGGTYVARVWLGSTGERDQAFSLTVHEPVPEPQIAPPQISATPEGCNVTLRCQAFGKGELNVSWETGYPPRTLEGGSDWYQLSANGSDLHVLWRPSFMYSNFTCLASNLADQKRVSFDLRSVCPSKGESQSRRKWYSLVVVLCVVVVIPAAALGIWLLKRRRKR